MTAILGAHYRTRAHQVSDRLVSLRYPRGQLKPYSESYNKSVALVAEDSILLVGFAGRAYVDGVPTDRFLANAIVGQQLPDGGFFVPPVRVGYLAVKRAVSILDEALRSDHSDEPVEVLVTGLKNRRGRTEMVRWIAEPCEDGHLRLRTHDRSPFPWSKGAHALAAIGQVTGDDLAEIAERIRKTRYETHSQVHQTIVDQIRSISDRVDGVGADCMAVTAWRENNRPVISASFISSGEAGDIGYGPWVLQSRGLGFSPSIVGGSHPHGGWNTSSGLDYRVGWMDDRPTDSSRLITWDSVGQPPDPSRSKSGPPRTHPMFRASSLPRPEQPEP